MRRVTGIILLFLASSLAVAAQDFPKAELFGGYQYTRQNSTNLSGWDANFTGNYNRWFGLTGDFSGAYSSRGGADFRSYTFAFGPTVAAAAVMECSLRSRTSCWAEFTRSPRPAVRRWGRPPVLPSSREEGWTRSSLRTWPRASRRSTTCHFTFRVVVQYLSLLRRDCGSFLIRTEKRSRVGRAGQPFSIFSRRQNPSQTLRQRRRTRVSAPHGFELAAICCGAPTRAGRSRLHWT